MDLAARAIQIVVERMVRYHEREQAHLLEVYGPDQGELRSAYEQVVLAADFETAYQDFVSKYGEEAWHKQVTLALGRG